MTLGVLCISYDGMLEPLGQSQVLAYLTLLATGRHPPHQLREARRLGQHRRARTYCARHCRCRHRLGPAAVPQTADFSSDRMGYLSRHCAGLAARRALSPRYRACAQLCAVSHGANDHTHHGRDVSVRNARLLG